MKIQVTMDEAERRSSGKLFDDITDAGIEEYGVDLWLATTDLLTAVLPSAGFHKGNGLTIEAYMLLGAKLTKALCAAMRETEKARIK